MAHRHDQAGAARSDRRRSAGDRTSGANGILAREVGHDPQATRLAACESLWPFPTPTSLACRTSACRRSTPSSTRTSASCASACSCRRSPRIAVSARQAGAARHDRVRNARPVDSTSSPSPSPSNGTTPTSSHAEAGGTRAARRPPARARSAGGDRWRRDVRESRTAGALRGLIAAGEAELLVPSIVEAFADVGDRDRPALLERLASETGCYVPSLYDVTYDGPGRVRAITPRLGSAAPPVVRKAAVKAADRLDPPATKIFTPDTEFGSRLLIEVVRGCANLCRFCWAGYNYLPVRAVPDRREFSRLPRPPVSTPRAIGLVSIALCDHPDIESILAQLVAMGYGISPASLRLDDLTETIVSLLRQSGEQIDHDRAGDRFRSAPPRDQQDGDERRDPGPRRSDLPIRHREPEALLHDRPPQRNRRRPRGDSRAQPGHPRAHDRSMPGGAARSAGSSRPSTRWCRSPARRTNGCR